MSTTLSDIDQKTNTAETQSKILAPKLRFKGFSDEWQNKKVGELCDSIVPGRNKPTTFKGEIPWITTPDIIHNGIITNSKSGLVISKDEAKKVGSKIVPVNSIIISCVGDLGLAATNGKEVVINQQLHAFIPKELINYKFLLYGLSIQKKYMDRVATKTAVPYMNKENCNSIPIIHPTLPEQQKIASFLSAVDEKIQQLSRKKELLEQYKKGVMQNLFSGKLRFKPALSEVEGDENGMDFPDWDEKRLGDVCSFFSGGTPASTNRDFYSGTIPFIGSGNIYDSEVFSFITEEAFNSSSAKIVEQGDLLYALYGANSGEVAISKIKGAINQAILCIRSNENIEYLYYVLLLNKDKIVAKYLQGGQGNLSANIIKRLKYTLPSSEEQKKISTYLSSIDTKIESVAKQITQTQTFKKGLLQQMFV